MQSSASAASASWTLTTLLCCLLPLKLLAEAPPNPLSISLVSAYGDTVCESQAVLQPTSTADVAAAVKQYYGASAGTPVKIRVIARARGFSAADGYRQLGFHDRSGFACAKGSVAGTKTVTLLLQNMRAVLKRSGVMLTVQSGMTVTELQRYATSQGLTVPLGVMPGYADLTIGGLLATGAHGFGGKGNSNMADIVKVITFVDGTGKIQRVNRNSAVGRGLAGGLGMLGVLTEITLRLQPGLGKTRSWSTGVRSDANIAQELDGLWKQHSNILIYWRPDLSIYKATITEEVPANTPFDPPYISDALLPFGGFLKPRTDDQLQETGSVVAAIHTDLPDPTTATGYCQQFAQATLDASQFGWAAGFKLNNGVPEAFLSDNATGLTNQLQNCDCDIPGAPPGTGGCFFDSAVWRRINVQEVAAGKTLEQLTPSMTLEEVEFTVNRKNVSAAIEDMKLMATKLLPDVCWPGVLVLLRTGGPTADNISPQTGSGSDRFLWVEYGQFRPNIPLPIPGVKARLQKKGAALQEYFEQLMVCKYKARPHWGKGWSRVFTSSACPIKDLYPASNLAAQLSLQQQFDPSKLFETEMLSAVLAGGVPRSPDPTPFCSNELGCYCAADIDCGAPADLQERLPGAALCCRTAPAGLSPYKVCLPCSG